MAEEIPQHTTNTGPSNTKSPVKTDRVPRAELKNGKVVFRQKPISFDKMSDTMQEIVNFRDMIVGRVKERCSPLEKMPEAHLPLIAKLIHESDKSMATLVKQIIHALQGDELETVSATTPLISHTALEAAISAMADRVNYGIESTEKVPSSLCVWRWELKGDRWMWLPKSAHEKASERLKERQMGKESLNIAFRALPLAEQRALLKSGKREKTDRASEPHTMTGGNGVTEYAALQGIDENASREGDEAHSSKKADCKAKKEQADPDKVAREAEKAEKRAARAEKERKEKEAQNKSRSLMSAFFSKPKVSAPQRLRSPQTSSTALLSPGKQVASSSTSDFEKLFKPFAVKKDAVIAPVNWFAKATQLNEVIVLDCDSSHDVEPVVTRLQDCVRDDLSSAELLKTSLADIFAPETLQRKFPKRPKVQSQYKSSSTYCVRSIMAELTEAEVSGDTAAVRRLLDLLSSRDAIPVKVLIFHDDTRPGYFGTFTKSSSVIGPRCPFNKDAVARNYCYDSGAEWEEEEEGADDLMSLDGSGDEEDGTESDLDDWLVDDDAVDDPGTPLTERAGSPVFPPPILKRKTHTAGAESNRTKKRKVVVPLVPFTKGLCWETDIGDCAYEPFQAMRIQLFNDTPYPVDPFTFVSLPVRHVQKATASAVVPPILENLAGPRDMVTGPGSLMQALLPAKRALNKGFQIPLKTPFPDIYLPLLISKINSLATSNLTFIVESVYQELKDHKIKKNAIEAKVREIGQKQQKLWVVKPNVVCNGGLSTSVA